MIIIFFNAENFIYEKLSKGAHYINDKCAYNYYNDFWKVVSKLDENDFFTSKKRVEEFCNKLVIGKKFEFYKYMQGVSEIMLWAYCATQPYMFNIDVKNNYMNNTDIDLQIKYKNYRFNIEVKCPTVSENVGKDILNINTGFRVMDKERLQQELCILEENILNPILNNSNGEFSGIKYNKIDDTKLLSYLISCKEKFRYSEKNEINVLFIALPSNMMQDYWGYLYNAWKI